MTAYELFQQYGSGTGDRRQYYLTLRQALLAEVRLEGESALLNCMLSFPAQARLPLLEAAAAWECCEQLSGARRGFRDIGRGFPFPLNGQIRPWSEIQRRAESGMLPGVVQDVAIRERLTALTGSPEAGCGALQNLDSRALLPVEPLPAMTAVPAHDTEREAEIDALREELRLLRQVRRNEEERTLQAAQMLLAGEIEEAKQLVTDLDERLQTALTELATVESSIREKQERLAAAQTELAEKNARLDALALQVREAQEAAKELEARCEKAKAEAQQAEREHQAGIRTLETAEEDRTAATVASRALHRSRICDPQEDAPASLADYL